MMDDWVLGCDICLEGCPFNKNCVEKKGQESFFPGDIGTYPLLETFLTISESEFQKGLMAHVNRKVCSGKTIGVIMALPGGVQLLEWASKRFLKGSEKVPDTLVHASSSLVVYRRNAIIAAANRGYMELRPLIERWREDEMLKDVACWALDKLNP